MSWNEFLKAVYTADFNESTRILSQSLKFGQSSDIAKQIEEEVEGNINDTLRIRDHILSFLGLESLNLALNVTSSNLMTRIGTCGDNIEARSKVFLWITELIETEDPRLVQYVLDIEDLSSSDFALFIPDILAKRLEEFQNAKISRSSTIVEDIQRNRYYIGNLWRTAYGRKLLVATEVTSDTNVIGDRLWGEVSNSLFSLGCDVDSILVDIGEFAWKELNQESEKRLKIRLLGSKELASLERCRNACIEIDSHNASIRAAALEVLRELDTNACNRKVAEIAQNGSSREQAYAIDILSSTGGAVEEKILSTLLNQCEPKIRRKVAEGLSLLVSREFSGGSNLVKRESLRVAEDLSKRSSKKKMKILESLSLSGNREARIDAAKSLAQLNTAAAEQILFRMSNDVDARVRVEIVNLIPDMSRALGTEVIRTALKDNSPVVRLAAIQIGSILWPEQEWPDM
ncbi:MAG: HEAT repeat domain-containing protein [Candidatus Thorarchaeota archaeon]|nr:HEAT repeat domain-containing protein [Candidatus Thorarchaeota archaeon]